MTETYEHTLKALETEIRFSRSNPEKFAKAMARLEQFEAEGLLLKIEHEGLKMDFNNIFEHVWSAAIREPFLYNAGAKKLTPTEQDLEQKLGLYPMTHTASGYLKRAEASKAEGEFRTAIINIMRELTPLGARVVALKAKIGKRAPKPTKTSIAQAERDAKAMTCQCCGRKILAEMGEIAHHGYQRPGSGYQTASCEGARELPFEVSRDALGAQIKRLEEYIIRQDAFRSRVQAESQDIMWEYADRTACTQRWHRGVEKFAMVNRTNFEKVLADTYEARMKLAHPHPQRVEVTFDYVKQQQIAKIDADIKATEKFLDHQRTRWIRWSQTHERKDDQWVALEA